MKTFQYFLATLPLTNCERLTLFCSPEILTVNINYEHHNMQHKWAEKLDVIDYHFWLEQVYGYIKNDKFWAGNIYTSYNSNQEDIRMDFLAYKEILMPTEGAHYSSYYLTLENKSKVKNVEPFNQTLSDYEPLKLYKKLQAQLPNKDPIYMKTKI